MKEVKSSAFHDKQWSNTLNDAEKAPVKITRRSHITLVLMTESRYKKLENKK